MPYSEYFKGKGDKVAKSMQKKYGADWKRVFYSTANSKRLFPKRKMGKSR